MKTWNLSSSSEEEDSNDEESLSLHFDDSKKSEKNKQEINEKKISVSNITNENENDSDSESNIEWEDGASIQSSDDDIDESSSAQQSRIEDNNVESHTSKILNMALKPLQFEIDDISCSDLNDNTNNKNKKKKNKSRRKLIDLHPSIIQLLESIQKSNLLALTCRAVFLSQSCSNDMLMHLAHSLIPSNILDQTSFSKKEQTYNEKLGLIDQSNNVSFSIPTDEQVQLLCNWFFSFINQALRRYQTIQSRNRSLGAPSMSSLQNRRTSRRGSSNSKNNYNNSNGNRMREPKSSRKRDHVSISSNKNKNDKTISSSMQNNLSYLGDGIGSSSSRLKYICHALSPPHYEDHLPFSIYEEMSDNYEHIRDNNIQFYKEDLLMQITPHEKAQILISIGRSLGWRVRYVSILETISSELTVNHPLFHIASAKSTLESNIPRILKYLLKKTKKIETFDIDTESSKISEQKSNEVKKRANLDHGNNPFYTTGWVEFLCTSSTLAQKKILKNQTKSTSSKSSHSNTNNSKQFKTKSQSSSSSSSQWIHVDVHRELFNKPLQVESILYQIAEQQKDNELKPRKRRKSTKLNQRLRKPVSYVLAVEHPDPRSHSSSPSDYIKRQKDETLQNNINSNEISRLQSARLTDVTPRYANVWSQTLLLRGTNVSTRKQRDMVTIPSHLKCSNMWWKNTLKSLNHSLRHNYRQDASQKRQSTFETKIIRMEVPENVDSSRKKSSNENNPSTGTKMVDVISINDDNEITYSDQEEDHETQEINEPLPTSMKAFNNHPLYALRSQLNQNEVLSPHANNHICGIFKGEFVFRRRDVSIVRTAKKWLYEGRKVIDDQLGKPVKKTKKKIFPKKGNFKGLESYGITKQDQTFSINAGNQDDDDGMDHLYGKWQTASWTPSYILPTDSLPINEHRNIEKALMNPGLVHLPQPYIAKVAKTLGVPYAPCLLGFEGHRGNRTPNIQGIVVHEHNEDILREAFVEWESSLIEKEAVARRKEILRRWTRLTRGLLTRDRLEREYGDGK